MADNTHLKRIRQTWYVQVAVPRKLQGILGKQVFLRSTSTRDVTEARRRRHAIVADFHKVIDSARQLQVSHETGLVGDLLNEAALLRRQMKAGLLTREEVLGEADYDPDTDERRETLGIWELLLDKLDWLPPGTLSEAQLQALRDAGSALQHPDRAHLSDAIDAYLSDKPNLRASTIQERRARLTAFLTWSGDRPVESIARPDAGRYVSDVLQRRGLSTSTVRQTVGDLSSFFRFCTVRGLSSASNPFEGIASSIRDSTRGTVAHANGRRRAWSDGELATLLNAPSTTGALLTLPLLALYTGCRLNELCEATVERVHETHLDVPEAKTTSGIREVPWHPQVNPLVRHLVQQSTDGYLVSGLTRGGYDNKRHHNCSKQFSYHRTRLGIPAVCVFHGFRKNFITQLVRHQVPTHEIQQLVGHLPEELVHSVYSEGVELERLAQVVALVDYGDIVAAAITRAIQEEPTRRSRGRPRQNTTT